MRIKSMITKDYFLWYLNKIISPTISKGKVWDKNGELVF